jgi:tRNA dimethylallyltransferase
MLQAGWVNEVRSLMEHVPSSAPAWNGTGYETVRSLVEGQLSALDAEERIVIDTRQYAKRQRTWFRNQLTGEDVTHLDPTAADWHDQALAWWEAEARA